jgi:hypothetical protein
MKLKYTNYFTLFLILFTANGYCESKNFRQEKKNRIEIESGIINVGHNNIGNNANGGALFNTNKIDSSNHNYARFSYYRDINNQDSIKILVAPLAFSGSGNLDSSFQYGDKNFTEGDAFYKYKFNSYRATYRRKFFENDKINFKAGLTLKVRDAAVTIGQGDTVYTQSNIGFVPLFHLNLDYRLTEKIKLSTEGDFMIAPQGRAIDFAFTGVYDLNSDVNLSLGYRILEGGAKNDKVYTMSLFNYYFLGLGVNF